MSDFYIPIKYPPGPSIGPSVLAKVALAGTVIQVPDRDEWSPTLRAERARVQAIAITCVACGLAGLGKRPADVIFEEDGFSHGHGFQAACPEHAPKLGEEDLVDAVAALGALCARYKCERLDLRREPT